MVRKVNKGVSMVEILIALAVFMILMIPLVRSLMASMKSTMSAKELQYRNEYAQNLMESIKEVPIAVLDDVTVATDFFKKMGSDESSIIINNPGTMPSASKEYTIQGNAYLGVERTEYTYAIKMSDSTYATGAMSPDKLESGIVEDLDEKSMALIRSASIADYDKSAHDKLLLNKISELKRDKEAANQEFDPTNLRIFDNDKVKRTITIKVENAIEGGYNVTCTLTYSDDSNILLSDGRRRLGDVIDKVEYTAYKKQFNTLSNIYLLYNVCVYNGKYGDDSIIYDISGMTPPDGMTEIEDVNVFVIVTAAQYSEDVKKAVTEAGEDWLKRGDDDTLYKTANAGDRNTVMVGMAVSGGTSDEKIKHLHVYHNLDDMRKPMRSAYPTEDAYNAALAAWEASLPAVAYHDTTDSTYKKVLDANVKGLKQAQQEARGLYEVKIWMQKGNTVDTTKDPVLEGTKGGGEID